MSASPLNQGIELVSKRPWLGVLDWVLTHPIARVTIPPLIFIALVLSLAAPLLNDLRQVDEDDLVVVSSDGSAAGHDGNLIVNITNINPNNGVATLNVIYETEDIEKGKVELWIASGSVTLTNGKLTYDVDTELHRVPVVMEAPTIFVWGETKRATYKEQGIDIKIDKTSEGYLYPFDQYVVEFSIAVIDQAQKTLHPTLWFELEDPRFVHDAPQSLFSHGEKVIAVPNSIKVVLDRPVYQQIFLGISMLTGLGCVIWSLYKITYTSVDRMESLSLLAFDFTVLLAVPALRGVFVPSNLQFAPLFDFFVVLIWTVGLLALVMNVVRHDIVVRIRSRTLKGANADHAMLNVLGDEQIQKPVDDQNESDHLKLTCSSRNESSGRYAA